MSVVTMATVGQLLVFDSYNSPMFGRLYWVTDVCDYGIRVESYMTGSDEDLLYKFRFTPNTFYEFVTFSPEDLDIK